MDRYFEGALALAAACLLVAVGLSMGDSSGDLPQPEGAEVGGLEEEQAEVGGEEEAAGFDDTALLPEGEHRDQVIAACTPCHGAALVARQRMDRKGWDETITWMQREQRLTELSGEKRGQVLDYLEAHLGPRPADAVDRRSPWAQPLYEPNPLW